MIVENDANEQPAPADPDKPTAYPTSEFSNEELTPPLPPSKFPPTPPPTSPRPNKLSKWILLALVAVVVGLGAGFGILYWQQNNPSIISDSSGSYEQCVSLPDSKIQESYPAVCVTAKGERYIEPINSPLTSAIPSFSPSFLPSVIPATGSASPSPSIDLKASPLNSPLASPTIRTKGGCIISGCNNEICSDQRLDSICVYKAEYSCYLSAVCEPQSDGKCGWSQTEELIACLKTYQ